MKLIIFFFTLFVVIHSNAQNCNCTDEFKFIKNHIEANHAGYNKKIKALKETDYKNFSEKLEANIKADTINKYCSAFLKKYLLYLQDNHSNISPSKGVFIKEEDTETVALFLKSSDFLNTEIIELDSNINKPNNENSIEGIYFSDEGSYTVAVIKNKNSIRDYAAVIINSKTKFWVKGQVKFELKQINDTAFEVFTYNRLHVIGYEKAVYTNKRLLLKNWNKANQSIIIKTEIDRNLIQFKKLDSITGLLSIRSFNASFSQQLDSAYKQIIPQLINCKTLIIDIRNNNGGDGTNFQKLSPLLYTDTIFNDAAEIYNTPDNLNAYQSYRNNILKISKKSSIFTSEIKLLRKKNFFTFIPNGSSFSKKHFAKSSSFPEKIAVLYNRNTASTAEDLITEASFSKKVILVGENSGGYTGYGNVMSTLTPCGNVLYWTTTIWQKGQQYEFVGIPPHYYVPDKETDWVEYTRKLLYR